MSTEKIRIVIADDLRLQRKVTRAAFETVDRFDIVGEATNGEELIEVAKQTRPDLILTDLHMPIMDGGEAIRVLSFALPECVFICFTLEGDIEKLRTVIACGAHDFIRKGLHVDQLLSLVEAIYERERPQRISAQAAPEVAEDLGTVISVIGAQAGSGASTLACGLATSLARDHGKRVVFLDFDFQAATSSAYLGLNGERGVLHLLQEVKRIDAESADEYLTPTQGLAALAGAPRPLDAARRDPGLLLRIIEAFRIGRDLVVVDLEPRIDETTMQLLGASHQVLFAAGNHPTDRRAAARWLRVYRGSLPPEGRLRLVQNQRFPGPSASAEALGEELGVEVHADLPHDPTWATGCEAAGMPPGDAPLAAGLQALAGRLAGSLTGT